MTQLAWVLSFCSSRASLIVNTMLHSLDRE
jgi:hypothetical protein